MSKNNYMPEVARMLGVEINEEFDLIYETGQKSDWGPYKIAWRELPEPWEGANNE